jgi:hypothetical protein
MTSRIPQVTAQGAHRAFMVQKKGTPSRYPRKSGGSPIGRSVPPMLLTSRMKKTTVWTLYRRCALVWRIGLISTMLAPVVPMKLAIIAPTARNAVLVSGRAARSPRRETPPLMT